MQWSDAQPNEPFGWQLEGIWLGMHGINCRPPYDTQLPQRNLITSFSNPLVNHNKLLRTAIKLLHHLTDSLEHVADKDNCYFYITRKY